MSLYQLARTGDDEGIRELLLDSDSPAVRARAATLLGEHADSTDTESIEALVSVSVTDDNEEVRAAAVEGLDAIGSEAVEQLLVKITGTKIEEGADWATARKFANALSSEVPELRMAAASALGQLGEASAVPKLVEALDDENPKVRVRICAALGQLDHPKAVPALIDRLSDASGEVRHEAAVALASIGTDQALAALLDMLDDSNTAIRRIAASSLGEAGTVRAVQPLTDALADESSAVRSAAVFSIIELLSNAPTQQSHQIRDTVVSELQNSDRATVQPLIEILDESTQTRQQRNAAWFLGRVVDEPDDKTIEVLVKALESSDNSTAQFAATSLSEIGGEDVEDELLEFVSDETNDEEARAKAVYVLGQVGGQRSADKIQQLTEDDSKQVRKRAFAAVSKFRGRQ
ncbi:MAG: HEAT repeat domain-containing protein [Halohasta sp.]